MKSQNKVQSLLFVLAAALIISIPTPASAQQPPFSATIEITPNPATVCVGETVTLTADWTTNRNVTRCQWYVDGVSQGINTIDASSGMSIFEFDATELEPGDYEVCFRIWHHNVNQSDRDATECVTITVEECGECDWIGESAWADGIRYVEKGNWATYTPYSGEELEVTLYAGQDMDAGTVSFSAPNSGVVTITITLNDGWRFADDDENVKIQDYELTPPAENPSPGQFDWKGEATGSSFSIDVPENNIYGVHVDVEREVCE